MELNGKNREDALVNVAGFAKNTENGKKGVLLVIEHSDMAVAEAAALYLVEVVGPAMERGLPAVAALLGAIKGGADPREAGEKVKAAYAADKRAEAINEAAPTAEAVAETDAILAAIRGANPGAGRVQ